VKDNKTDKDVSATSNKVRLLITEACNVQQNKNTWYPFNSLYYFLDLRYINTILGFVRRLGILHPSSNSTRENFKDFNCRSFAEHGKDLRTSFGIAGA
jgi:hypothetical protein